MADRYLFNEYLLDGRERRLTRRGEAVHLEPRSFDLLRCLVERPGMLVTKAQIFDSVWPGVVVSDNALTRAIHQIRKALGDDADEPAPSDAALGQVSSLPSDANRTRVL